MKRRFAGLFLLLCLLSQTALASESVSVPAKAAVLLELSTGRVLFAKNENELLPIASVTKIMTCLLALENASPNEPVTAGKSAHGVPGTSIYLSVGETLTMEEMLYGLMLRSGNDAAVAIAEHISGSVSEFAKLMNERAAELGADAFFTTPNGLDSGNNGASALAVARIAREALSLDAFRAIVKTQKKTIPWSGNPYDRLLENKNKLLATYEGAIGIKTGYTSKAGRCLAFAAERNGMTLVGAVLNCYTWFDTAKALLDMGFETYRMETLAEAGERAREIPCGGSKDTVEAVLESSLTVPLAEGERAEIVLHPSDLQAPVREGDIVGTAEVVVSGERVLETNLIAANSARKNSYENGFLRLLRDWLLRIYG